MIAETVWSKFLLMAPQDVPPSHADWQVIGAFNPGATVLDGSVVLLVRVAERPREQRPGYMALPRWDHDSGPVVDWVSETDIELVDPRVVRLKKSGHVRLTFTSHLRVVFCGTGKTVRGLGAAFTPETPYETYGVEDPRITWIDDRYWITYVAVSRHGAATALASTTDFQVFQRHGIIFPPENKDVTLFPERVGGQYLALHRPNGATPFTAPEMWTATSNDLTHWGQHRPLLAIDAQWSTGRVGGGCPPIRVGDHWLEIYHGNQRPEQKGEVGRYVGAAMLLDGDQPWRIVAAEKKPWLEPSEPFERDGLVPDVVFPTGIAQIDHQLLVYYGAADCNTAVAATGDDILRVLEGEKQTNRQ